jgi:hypothetical protein
MHMAEDAGIQRQMEELPVFGPGYTDRKKPITHPNLDQQFYRNQDLPK